MKTCKTCDYWVSGEDFISSQILNESEPIGMKICADNNSRKTTMVLDNNGDPATFCTAEDFGCVRHSGYFIKNER